MLHEIIKRMLQDIVVCMHHACMERAVM